MTHDHDHRPDADRRSLAIALALIVAFLIAEVTGAVIAGSIALLADAGHMLTDAGALAFALFAATLASRPAQGRWTFGYKRLEILAAQVNGITLLVVALLILYGSVRRLVSPSDVRGGIVLSLRWAESS
jgi:cobalt-zinc-cadmium efflux system protein